MATFQNSDFNRLRVAAKIWDTFKGLELVSLILPPTIGTCPSGTKLSQITGAGAHADSATDEHFHGRLYEHFDTRLR